MVIYLSKIRYELYYIGDRNGLADHAVEVGLNENDERPKVSRVYHRKHGKIKEAELAAKKA